MNIAVVDTETISIDKPFCYNLGYVIVNVETRETLLKRDYIIEQIWNNHELFATAFYAEKRPIYTSAMRGKRTIMDKWGYIQQQMLRDFKTFEVDCAFAYNSPFDARVFDFNADWFKTANALETVPFLDIRGYAHEFIAVNDDFQQFCEGNGLFTESGNYSTTAETLFRYITQNTDFNEAHTALADAEIEAKILFTCVDKGATIGKTYVTRASIPRSVERNLTIVQNGEEYPFTYHKRVNRGNKIFLS